MPSSTSVPSSVEQAEVVAQVEVGRHGVEDQVERAGQLRERRRGRWWRSTRSAPSRSPSSIFFSDWLSTVTSAPIACASLTPMWPSPPRPMTATFLPGPAFQWRSGEYRVMPAHSSGAAVSSGIARGCAARSSRRRRSRRCSRRRWGPVTAGGVVGAIVVDENYVLRIPDAIPLEAAAPLLCAGITLYSPLRHWNAGPDTRVAVIGLGGLGHMGVKLAAAMGAKVTVLEPVAEEDGGRPSAGRERVLRDLRSRDVRQARRLVRPDLEHRVGQPGPERLPEPARRSTARWSNSVCPNIRCRSRPFRWSAADAACPDR